jgi:hypothetical protein
MTNNLVRRAVKIRTYFRTFSGARRQLRVLNAEKSMSDNGENSHDLTCRRVVLTYVRSPK